MSLEIISVENLSHNYGRFTALDNINFSIMENNEVIGLLGPNGAGKTTLVNILSTILKPSSGKVRMFGYDVVSEVDKVRPLVSVVPQKNNMLDFNMTVYDNLYFFAMLNFHSNKKDVLTVLEMFGLTDVKDKPLVQMSGGTVRKLMLARLAFISECRLLFLDEPTAGIDVYGRRAFYRSLKTMQAELGLKILITTHDLVEAEELCNRVLIINNGKMVENISVQEIKKESDKKVIVSYKELVNCEQVQDSLTCIAKSLFWLPDGSLCVIMKNAVVYSDMIRILEKFGQLATVLIDQVSLEEYFKNAIEESEKI